MYCFCDRTVYGRNLEPEAFATLRRLRGYKNKIYEVCHLSQAGCVAYLRHRTSFRLTQFVTLLPPPPDHESHPPLCLHSSANAVATLFATTRLVTFDSRSVQASFRSLMKFLLEVFARHILGDAQHFNIWSPPTHLPHS